MSADHLNITDLRYAGASYKENVGLILSMGMVQNVRMEDLRFDLPENGLFSSVVPLQGTRLERCLVAGVELSAPAETFYSMVSLGGASDLLIRDIHAESVGTYAGLFCNYFVTRVVVRNMTLDELSAIPAISPNKEASFFGITAFRSSYDMQQRASLSQVVVDIPDALLTAPVFLMDYSEDSSQMSTLLEQFYYTDEAGRFDPARDFWSVPDEAVPSTDGIYCVTREQLCSQETLDALNRPLNPDTDKTTGNRWSRDDSYCGGCPVPAACSPIAPPAPATTYGDVDESGKIDASDALCILQASVRLRELGPNQAEVADVNGDHQVNAADALLVLQHSVRLIDRFPMDPYPSVFEFVAG